MSKYTNAILGSSESWHLVTDFDLSHPMCAVRDIMGSLTQQPAKNVSFANRTCGAATGIAQLLIIGKPVANRLPS
jgi:hypothetical protein